MGYCFSRWHSYVGGVTHSRARAHTHTHKHLCIFVCTYAHKNKHATHVHACMQTMTRHILVTVCVPACVCIHAHTPKCVCVCECVYIIMYVFVYVYTHTSIYSHRLAYRIHAYFISHTRIQTLTGGCAHHGDSVEAHLCLRWWRRHRIEPHLLSLSRGGKGRRV